MGWRNAPLVTPTAKGKAKKVAGDPPRLPSENILDQQLRAAAEGRPAPPTPPPRRRSWEQAPVVKNERSWLDVPGEAVQNIPSSAIEFGKSLVEMVSSPVQTVTGLVDLGAGALQKAVPAPVRDFINQFEFNPEAQARAIEVADQVGGVYRQRYGSEEAVKRTLATDPVGAAGDISTILTGGAGAARMAARAAPSAAPKLTQAANVLQRGADITNPINVMAKPAAVVPKAIQRAPVAAQRLVSPKGAAYMEAAEGRAPQIIQQLRSPDLEIVPGSLPTAAQAASPVGATKFSALGASAEKVLSTEYFARGQQQQAARGAAVQSVGGTPADITAAVAAREAATSPLYRAAEARRFAADPQLLQLADDPYIRQALPDATRLSESQGVSFASNPTRYIHNVKISLDKMLARTGETALARGERAQVMDVRNRLVGWLETKAPEYGQARTTFAGMSKPINQMEVGQYLEGKLATPLEVGERANVFAAAVKDASGTLKRATTNEARFKALTDVLTPDQVRVVEAVRDDLARAAETKVQARAGAATAPSAFDTATAAASGIRPPQFLSRVAMVASDIMKRLSGKIDRKLAIQIATEMLDPQAAATALEKAMLAETRAANVGKTGAAAARAVGRGLRAPATVAAARARNAMLDMPAGYDAYGEPLYLPEE
jgi:hypothetical protein